jgi:glutathione S-transferase
MTTLVTIPFSHYCEKARWALDWCRVPYRERAVLPGLHFRHTRPVGGRTVPVLLRDDGEAPLLDSTDILRWVDTQAAPERRLWPTAAAEQEEAERLEEDFDTRLGPATRQWAYAHGLRDPAMLCTLVRPGFPKWRDRVALRMLLPVMGRFIVRQYEATMENAARAEETIVAVFAEVSARVDKSRYLTGDRFGAADLTFAALGGVMVRPKEHPAFDCQAAATPYMQAFMERLRATPAGEYAMRLYREHRQ